MQRVTWQNKHRRIKSMPRSENDRIELECQKLEEEIRQLKRPFLVRPSSWIAVLLAAGSLLGNLKQYQNYRDNNIAAESQVISFGRSENTIQERLISLEKEREEMARARQTHLAVIDSLKIHLSQQSSTTVQNQTKELEKVAQQIKQSAQATARPTLYIHIADEIQREPARLLKEELEQFGYVVPGIENVSKKATVPSGSNVRYYRQEEASEVAKLIELIKDHSEISKLTAYDLSQSKWAVYNKPRLFELWLSKDALR